MSFGDVPALQSALNFDSEFFPRLLTKMRARHRGCVAALRCSRRTKVQQVAKHAISRNEVLDRQLTIPVQVYDRRG